MQPFNNISKISHAGMDGLIFYFKGSLLDANRSVQTFHRAIMVSDPAWLTSSIPSYDSVLICYDSLQVDSHAVYQFCAGLDLQLLDNEEGTHHRIPVWYGAPQANDFAHIAEQISLSQEKLIQIHTTTTFRVFAVGFAPGFAYMGELPDELVCPRQGTPRKAVPQGAVAIAEKQTAIYPAVSPGGWNLIGMCPWYHNLQHHSDLPLFAVGDSVSFVSITERKYMEMTNDK